MASSRIHTTNGQKEKKLDECRKKWRVGRERESLIKKYIHTQNEKSISFTFVTDKTKHKKNQM